MIALLLKLPFILNLFSWGKEKAVPFVKEKSRLLIEYALLAVLLVTLGLSFSLWLSRKKTDDMLTTANEHIELLKTRVAVVEQVNEFQQGTIDTLEQLRAQDAKALTGLSDDYERLNSRDQSVRKRIQELEKTNAQVRSYLDQPLPDDLRSLLNQSKD